MSPQEISAIEARCAAIGAALDQLRQTLAELGDRADRISRRQQERQQKDELLRSLWSEGLKDRAIAERLGLTPPAVCMWRGRLGLPSKFTTRGRIKAQALPPALPVSSRTPPEPEPKPAPRWVEAETMKIMSVWPAVHFLRERDVPVLDIGSGRLSIHGQVVETDEIIRRANVKRAFLKLPLFVMEG